MIISTDRCILRWENKWEGDRRREEEGGGRRKRQRERRGEGRGRRSDGGNDDYHTGWVEGEGEVGRERRDADWRHGKWRKGGKKGVGGNTNRKKEFQISVDEYFGQTGGFRGDGLELEGRIIREIPENGRAKHKSDIFSRHAIVSFQHLLQEMDKIVENDLMLLRGLLNDFTSILQIDFFRK